MMLNDFPLSHPSILYFLTGILLDVGEVLLFHLPYDFVRWAVLATQYFLLPLEFYRSLCQI